MNDSFAVGHNQKLIHLFGCSRTVLIMCKVGVWQYNKHMPRGHTLVADYAPCSLNIQLIPKGCVWYNNDNVSKVTSRPELVCAFQYVLKEIEMYTFLYLPSIWHKFNSWTGNQIYGNELSKEMQASKRWKRIFEVCFSCYSCVCVHGFHRNKSIRASHIYTNKLA